MRDARAFAVANAGRRVRLTTQFGVNVGTICAYSVADSDDEHCSGIIIGADDGRLIDADDTIHAPVIADARHGRYYDPGIHGHALQFLDDLYATKSVPKKKDDRFPHQCPACKGPAYVGAYDFECKVGCRL